MIQTSLHPSTSDIHLIHHIAKGLAPRMSHQSKQTKEKNL